MSNDLHARLPVPDGDGPHALAVGSDDVVVLRAGGAWRAYQGRCPHQGALLGEGELENGELVCRNHRWRFNAETGERRGGPGCLRACAVKLDGVELEIDASALAVESAQPDRLLRTVNDLPGPRGVPIFGNALQLDLPRVPEILEGWAREYGPLYQFRLGKRVAVASSDPDLNEQAMRGRPESFRRESGVSSVFPELGLDGVFSAEGERWRRERRLAMEALAARHLRTFFPKLAEIAARLLARWQRAADEGRVLDVEDEMKRFTVDVTTSLALGHDARTLEKEGDVIQRHLEQILPAANRRLFSVIKYWRWFRMPLDRKVDRSVRAMQSWLRERVAEARAKLAGDADAAAAPENLLEAMVVARDDAGQPFTDETILGNALTMLVAGEDTTSHTLNWAIHELLERPEAVTRLRAELDGALGDGETPRDLDHVTRLGYSAAVAQETMRKRPVAPMVGLEALRDVVVGDVSLKAGTVWVALLHVPVHDAARFEEPLVFKPERWLDGKEARAHMPFGSGPRICPGRSLALLEMRLALAMIYRNFEVERVGSAESVKSFYAVTDGPKGNFIKVKRRCASP